MPDDSETTRDGTPSLLEQIEFSSSSSSLSLLKTLERDFTKKKSIKECLRSKIIPCPEVKKVLLDLEDDNTPNKVTRQDLLKSYSLIHTLYLDPIRHIEQEVVENRKPCLYYISKLATVNHFIQLLLECRVEDKSKIRQQDDEPIYVAASINQDEDIIKLILQLIKSYAGVVCNCYSSNYVENVEKESDDNSENDCDSDLYNGPVHAFNVSQLASFALGSLLKLNEYACTRPFLLPSLWKGLCDIASIIKTPIPPEIIEEALSLLSQHLKDGIEITLATSCSVLTTYRESLSRSSSMKYDTDQQTFPLKILSFLLNRMSTIFRLSISNDNRTKQETIESILIINGLSSAIEDSLHQISVKNGFTKENAISGLPSEFDDCIKPYRLLAAKTESCLIAFLSRDDLNGDLHASNFNHDNIKLLLLSEIKMRSIIESSEAASLGRKALSLGHASILMKILSLYHPAGCNKELVTEPVPWFPPDVNSIISICELLVFRVLPMICTLSSSNNFTQNNVVDCALRVISATLVAVESTSSCVASSAYPGRNKFHRLLIQWLRPRAQRMNCLMIEISFDVFSQEFVKSILYSHLICLFRISKADDAQDSLLKLLVLLFFDPRTDSNLRRNISSLLQRISKSDEKNGLVAAKLRSMFQDRFRIFLGLFRDSHRNNATKRKRSSSSMRSQYHLINLHIIVDSLHFFPACTKWNSGGIQFDTNVNRESALTKQALIAMAIGVSSTEETMESDLRLIKTFCKVWNSGIRRQRRDLLYRKCMSFFTKIVGGTVSIATKTSGRHTSSKAFERICNLIRLFITTSSSEKTNDNTSPFMALSFEAICLIGPLGIAINPSLSTASFQMIAKIFHDLLSDKMWPIRSFAMSAFVKFISTIPSEFKEYIPACLPDGSQPFLQSRLQKNLNGCHPKWRSSIDKNDKIMQPTNSEKWRRGNKLFELANSIVIPTGSYFMTMPTQGGRSAIVIFPPCHQSLEDIALMLGQNDEDDGDSTSAPQKIYSVRALQNGDCKVLLCKGL